MTAGTRRLLEATTDVNLVWLLGYLASTLDAIAAGNTGDLTPAAYARSHLEELAADAEAGWLPKVDREVYGLRADLDRIRAQAGLTPVEFFGSVPS